MRYEIQIIDGDQKDDFPIWEVHIRKKRILGKSTVSQKGHEPWSYETSGVAVGLFFKTYTCKYERTKYIYPTSILIRACFRETKLVVLYTNFVSRMVERCYEQHFALRKPIQLTKTIDPSVVAWR